MGKYFNNPRRPTAVANPRMESIWVVRTWKYLCILKKFFAIPIKRKLNPTTNKLLSKLYNIMSVK